MSEPTIRELGVRLRQAWERYPRHCAAETFELSAAIRALLSRLDAQPALRAGMTEEAHARVRKAVDVLGDCSDGWKKRAEIAEHKLAARVDAPTSLTSAATDARIAIAAALNHDQMQPLTEACRQSLQEACDRLEPPLPKPPEPDDYVAFLRNRHEGERQWIELCDSDSEGAFKVYRHKEGR